MLAVAALKSLLALTQSKDENVPSKVTLSQSLESQLYLSLSLQE